MQQKTFYSIQGVNGFAMEWFSVLEYILWSFRNRFTSTLKWPQFINIKQPQKTKHEPVVFKLASCYCNLFTYFI